MKQRGRFFTIFTLGLLSAIGPFSIDMYLPGFPQIASDFNTTVASVSLSLSSFFIGVSAGQLIYGPLLDRYGRRTPLMIGLLVYIASSFSCVFVHSVHALIVLRFFQAIGACAGMVAARALVRDIFHTSEIAKVFSLLMLVIGVSPILAPTCGGFMAASIGWRYIFVTLGSLGVIIISFVYFQLPQGRPADKSFSLKPPFIIASFISVFKHPQFYTYAFAGAFASAGMYAYIAGSPFVFMQLFHASAQVYGIIFAVIAIGLITSSQCNTILLRKYSSQQVIIIALALQSCSGILIFATALLHIATLFSTVALVFMYLSCQGFVFPNSSALSLAPFPNNAGTASALMGAIQLGVGTLSSALVSVLSNGTALPMTGIMFACTTTSFIILIIGKRFISHQCTKEKVAEEAVEMIVNS